MRSESAVTSTRHCPVGRPALFWPRTQRTPAALRSRSISRSELVSSHRADEGRPASQRGEPGRGIGSRSTGDLDPGTYELDDPSDLLAIDEGHRLGLDARCDDGRRFNVGEPIDDGMAETHDLGPLVTGLLVRAS